MDMNNCESQWTATVVVTDAVSDSRVLVGHVVGKAMRQQLQQLQQLQRLQQLQQLQQRYSSATAELQQNYSSYSRATVTPPTTPPHKELQSRLQRSYSAATVRYSSYSVAPGLPLPHP